MDLIRKVVIAGGDSIAPVVSAAIANSLRGQSVAITVVEPEQKPTGAHSTLPLTSTFHHHLGLSPEDLIQNTNASFKLGVDYTDWVRSGRNFLHPFGAHGTILRLVPFHHYYMKQRLAGDETEFGAYSLAESAARDGRFCLPDTDPNSILSTFACGIHVDSASYAAWLRSYASDRGVTFVSGELAGANQDSENGNLRALVLADGRQIEGDLFIDCSGDDARLIGKVLGQRYDEWSRYLPADSAIGLSVGDLPDLPPITFVVGKRQGWLRRIPMRDRSDYELYFSSNYQEVEQANDGLRKLLGRPILGEQRTWRFRNGRRERFWFRNCIAIGRSAGFMEPLEISGLSLAQSAVIRLMGMFPDRRCHPAMAREYNRQTGQEYANLLDFLCLFYHSAGSCDSEFWNQVRSLEIPDSLRERLELFTSHGRVVWNEHELLPKEYWVSAFLGLGHVPKSYDPLSDVPSEHHVLEWLARMREAVQQATSKMPSHGEFLEKLSLVRPSLGD